MKKIKFFCILMVGFLIIATILYHIPQKRELTIPVCTLDGTQAQVKLDIQYYRRLNGPYIKGTLYFNGEAYVDEDAKQKTVIGLEAEPFSLNFYWDGVPENSVFIKASTTDLVQMPTNQIFFFDIRGGADFQQIALVYMDESQKQDNHVTGVNYYGPAQTGEDAARIAASFQKP